LTQNHHQKLEAQLGTQFAKQVFNLAQWLCFHFQVMAQYYEGMVCKHCEKLAVSI